VTDCTPFHCCYHCVVGDCCWYLLLCL